MSKRGPNQPTDDVMATDFDEFEETGSFTLPAWTYRVKDTSQKVDPEVEGNIDQINYQIRIMEPGTFGTELRVISNQLEAKSVDDYLCNFAEALGSKHPDAEKFLDGYKLVGVDPNSYWEGVKLIVEASRIVMMHEGQLALLNVLEVGAARNHFEGEIETAGETVRSLFNQLKRAQTDSERKLCAGKLLYSLRRERNN